MLMTFLKERKDCFLFYINIVLVLLSYCLQNSTVNILLKKNTENRLDKISLPTFSCSDKIVKLNVKVL